MTVTNFLDTILEKDTIEIEFRDQFGNQLINIDFDFDSVVEVNYHKRAVLVIIPSKNEGFSV